MEEIRVGLKVNENTLTTDITLDSIYEMLKPYIHGDQFVIGYDKVYAQTPHYHFHFVSQSQFKTITAMKLRKLKLGKTCKLYQAKEYAGARVETWFGYACKENIIKTGSVNLDDVKIEAGVQLQIKILKANHAKKEGYKKEEKQKFKDLLFAYVDKSWKNNFGQLQKEIYICSYTDMPTQLGWFKVICLTIADYGIENNRFMMRAHLERYALEYLVKTKSWSNVDLFNYYFPPKL